MIKKKKKLDPQGTHFILNNFQALKTLNKNNM